ncbi:MAG: ribonuclease G [Pseudohongiella sp.]|uniref:ribonuclease G n=1 Tax=Pseudohongiella sp. TaxID=1979412 RepID=UPI0034A03A4C
MSEEILINVTPRETRLALIENGLLQEIYIERRSRSGHVGDIYLGKVVRVMPGMEAAFVDIGLERAAFLHAADIAAIGADGLEVADAGTTDIQKLLHEGQMIVVQVAKDPIGSKGARLTTHLTLPSRHLVYLPRNAHIGISLRLENEAERERLLAMLSQCLDREVTPDKGGFIIRTAAEGATDAELGEDIRFLRKLWATVAGRIEKTREIRVLYRDLPLYLRAVRDLITPQVERIRVDSEEAFGEINNFVGDFIPDSLERVELYRGERPIFDLYSIDDELDKALGRQVKLKSGGDLIIDQTEAMTTIDVNTGGYLGSKNHAETVLKTNLEAATAIARQLRIRNLGGIIILDFIDMVEPEHQRQLLRTLTKALEKDHARTMISGISELGLVEMTRKRTRESLGQVLCCPCPVCEGRGRLKTPETICYEIFREIVRVARAYENDELLVMASQLVVDRLLEEESATLADLEALTGKTIRFQVEPMYTQEQYDVVLF